MADDILESAASATQGMIPGASAGPSSQPMTTFGPTPIVQPPPIPRFQPPPSTQQGKTSFESVGSRKRYDRQQTISGIANFVKAGADFIAAKKQRALSLDIQRLMEAQQGLQEAQQALQQNPNDPAAKEAVARNTGIINDLTSDPKKAKLFQKAFNIDLFGDGKNKKENMALMDAWKQFNQKQQAGDKTALNPIAQRMMQQQPMRQGMSADAMAQAAAIKAGLQPDANAKLQAMAQQANRVQQMQIEKMREANDLKIAQMTASQIEGGGTIVLDPDPTSKTGVQKLQTSKDGKTIRVTKDVVVPGILPSEHEGSSVLTVPDPENPERTLLVRVPNNTMNKKVLPGGKTVGAGGQVQQDPNSKNGKGVVINKEKTDLPGSTPDGRAQAKKMGLPPGSTVISPKALSGAQIAKLSEGITSLQGTVERLKDIRQYTDLYQNMLSAGKIKLATDPRTGKRILAGFVPTTEDEKKAAAAWQESAEYMNNFRAALNAQGFRSIPAYDNMLALRGQLWQDKTILNKTIDDSISFLNKAITTKKKLLGDTKDTEREDRENPAGLVF